MTIKKIISENGSVYSQKERGLKIKVKIKDKAFAIYSSATIILIINVLKNHLDRGGLKTDFFTFIITKGDLTNFLAVNMCFNVAEEDDGEHSYSDLTYTSQFYVQYDTDEGDDPMPEEEVEKELIKDLSVFYDVCGIIWSLNIGGVEVVRKL